MNKVLGILLLFMSVAFAGPDVCYILVLGDTKAKIKKDIAKAQLSAKKVEALQQVIGEVDIISLPSGKTIKKCLSGNPTVVPTGTIYEVDREIVKEYGEELEAGLAKIGGIEWLTHDKAIELVGKK
jgi:hypothetical protein